ncbi:hypothetical protein PSACC_01771 [Paramicrosporidium saccamoebae]|uniref:Uncharacterized protein n=1 Tax=Paramicrosporidium saccamoebae TaxID=1246581 RepID=A0A2H9TKV9_9FUNG|nr:hypothetical protein PSACC_01771 [Paramicrosporidium saccamoebae]
MSVAPNCCANSLACPSTLLTSRYCGMNCSSGLLNRLIRRLTLLNSSSSYNQSTAEMYNFTKQDNVLATDEKYPKVLL